jgi:uncharacterized membrane protein YhiD involved in acid resistance
MTAAIGVTVGLGAVGLAVLSTLLALIILAVATKVEELVQKKREEK